MDLLVALIAIGIGALALFAGFKLFLTLLPVFGFFVGFVAGAQIVSELLGEGFLVSVLGIVVGVVLAIAFALLAIFWWWAGVVIAIGGFGFAIGYGILPAIGFEEGIISWLIGATVAVLFAVVAVVLRLPRALVVVATSLWGSGAALAGVLIILNLMEVEEIGYGGVDRVLTESTFWMIAWIVLAIVGMVAQITTTDEVSLVPDDASMYPTMGSGRGTGTP
jgi:Domain of unknown function (DUF4203)